MSVPKCCPAGRCQAVGGSSTGTVSADSDATWCDIFPNVPKDVYAAKVVDIYKRIRTEVAGDVPLKGECAEALPETRATFCPLSAHTVAEC